MSNWWRYAFGGDLAAARVTSVWTCSSSPHPPPSHQLSDVSGPAARVRFLPLLLPADVPSPHRSSRRFCGSAVKARHLPPLHLFSASPFLFYRSGSNSSSINDELWAADSLPSNAASLATLLTQTFGPLVLGRGPVLSAFQTAFSSFQTAS